MIMIVMVDFIDMLISAVLMLTDYHDYGWFLNFEVSKQQACHVLLLSCSNNSYMI